MTGLVVQDLSGPHYVYRCFDADGGLLYVGCSKWPLDRIKAHRMNAWWGGEHDHHQLIVWPNREKALAIERRAIHSEMPRCNVKGRWYRLDPREHWTAQDYLTFHHAIVQAVKSVHPSVCGTNTQRLLSDVAAELLARHNVSIVDQRRSA